MADENHSPRASSRTPLIRHFVASTAAHTECHPLDFKRPVIEPEMRAAAQSSAFDTTPIFDNLEDAFKIIAGLATVCRLARNNQALASNASEEGPPLSSTAMEDLFNLAEVTAERFISDIEALAEWQAAEEAPE
jgi:hypothetical protein